MVVVAVAVEQMLLHPMVAVTLPVAAVAVAVAALPVAALLL